MRSIATSIAIEATPMRPRRPSALLKPSALLELASHAAMGVALGLAFSLILIVTPAFGVSALIALGSNPHDILLKFVGTCALMFGIGAALTGLVFKVTEDS